MVSIPFCLSDLTIYCVIFYYIFNVSFSTLGKRWLNFTKIMNKNNNSNPNKQKYLN